MNGSERRLTGGCLCGALRYRLDGEPLYTGLCYCADCRKASGSGFVPFMGYPSHAVHIEGPTRTFTCRAARGGDAVRNSCLTCHSLVFGGVVGQDTSHTIYAGSLDDPTAFSPSIAIFTRDRPSWAVLPSGIQCFEGAPG